VAPRTAAKPKTTKTRAATTALARRRRTPADKSGDAVAPRADSALGLGAVALAMLLGGIGFAFHPFWIGAIVVMAILLGTMLSERRGAARHSVALDVVAAVVDQVRDAAPAAK
jgi:hypothetical protein